MSRATEALDKLIAEMPPMSKRMLFHDKCAAFYAMERGFSQNMVAKVFGSSSAAMSALAHCLNSPNRYQDVAREYERLGREAFGERYFTDEIETRFQVWRVKTQAEALAVKPRGPDPRPGKWGNKIFLVEDYQHNVHACLVSLRSYNQDVIIDTDEYAKQGWAWRYLTDVEYGQEKILDKPTTCPPWSRTRWPTAAQAVDGAYEGHGVESERLTDNWPNHRPLK